MTIHNFLRPTTIIFNQTSKKTSWGPNTLFLPGKYFVGTQPPGLKYYWPFPKKPHEPYGRQGTNHLIKERGVVYKNLPVKIKWEKDKVYSWCACGYSNNQPFCDGSHNRYLQVRNIHPIRYIPEKTEEVWLCQCKKSKNRPFCDGTHKYLKEEHLKTAREIVKF